MFIKYQVKKKSKSINLLISYTCTCLSQKIEYLSNHENELYELRKWSTSLY